MTDDLQKRLDDARQAIAEGRGVVADDTFFQMLRDRLQARVKKAELERRLSLPLDQWEPVGEASSVTAGARTHLAALVRKTDRKKRSL